MGKQIQFKILLKLNFTVVLICVSYLFRGFLVIGLYPNMPASFLAVVQPFLAYGLWLPLTQWLPLCFCSYCLVNEMRMIKAEKPRVSTPDQDQKDAEYNTTRVTASGLSFAQGGEGGEGWDESYSYSMRMKNISVESAISEMAGEFAEEHYLSSESVDAEGKRTLDYLLRAVSESNVTHGGRSKSPMHDPEQGNHVGNQGQGHGNQGNQGNQGNHGNQGNYFDSHDGHGDSAFDGDSQDHFFTANAMHASSSSQRSSKPLPPPSSASPPPSPCPSLQGSTRIRLETEEGKGKGEKALGRTSDEKL
ncbi:hypothetical protein B484DRAFT_153224 [Ochromonadaceae sp. CCMP2298]|nr:hypothetical protein B484DRAFT_153224 [Ochromonadaceae sp. CCMP2298]